MTTFDKAPPWINHPAHYNRGKFECIDVIEDWKLSFNLGNCLKYICRAEHKGQEIDDLKKAYWYLSREIEKLEKEFHGPKTGNSFQKPHKAPSPINPQFMVGENIAGFDPRNPGLSGMHPGEFYRSGIEEEQKCENNTPPSPYSQKNSGSRGVF